MLTPEKMIETIEETEAAYRAVAMECDDRKAKLTANALHQLARDFRAQLEAEKEPQ